MFDIREYIKKTLDDYFYDLNIETWPEEKTNSIITLPKEYIVFNSRWEKYRYADNIPISKKYEVEVIYIGDDITKKSVRVNEITKAMVKGDFRVISQGTDLQKELNSPKYGFISKFTLDIMVNGYE